MIYDYEMLMIIVICGLHPRSLCFNTSDLVFSFSQGTHHFCAAPSAQVSVIQLQSECTNTF